jgi:hypothetical protein
MDFRAQMHLSRYFSTRESSSAIRIKEGTDRYRIGWRNSAYLVPALVFALIVLGINRALFTTSIIESSDFAANALQVQNAKHLAELLGNYSRWRFHHPGPAFFYIYAAGEWIFYDLLHLVPAPFNNGSHHSDSSEHAIFVPDYQNIPSSQPQPVVPFASCWCGGSFPFSLWAKPFPAPQWRPFGSPTLFCFLLFACACASVAAGKWDDVVALAFSGCVRMLRKFCSLWSLALLQQQWQFFAN